MTNTNDPKKNVAPAKNSRRLLIFVGLGIGILVVLLAVKIYLDHQEKIELEEHYQMELTLAQEKLESISEELDRTIQQIDSLGGDIDDLLVTKSQLKGELKQLQATRQANRQLIGRLRRKTEGYEELLKEKDKEIERLAQLNVVLLTENTDLKTDKRELNRSIVELSEEKTELETKVSVAGELEVENFGIFSVSKSGRERDGVLRKKHIDKLKVVFNITENELAELKAREIMIRITDQNDQVLFDVATGSGSFILDGKETFYTASQDILFDNSNQQLMFMYDKGSPYESGTYNMEVFTDGYLMGAELFTVK